MSIVHIPVQDGTAAFIHEDKTPTSNSLPIYLRQKDINSQQLKRLQNKNILFESWECGTQ